MFSFINIISLPLQNGFNLLVSMLNFYRKTGGETMKKSEEQTMISQYERRKYRISVSLVTLCILSIFIFCLLIPFVLEPSISTLFHQFVPHPAKCQVI